jgi:plastocyanin
MHLSRSIVTTAAATLAFSLACGSEPTGGNNLPGADTTPAAIAVAGGNSQTGTVSTALSNPLVVKVTNAAGDTLVGVQVNWAVTAGGGTLSSASSLTNSQGRAQVTLTLGPNVTLHTVSATVHNTSLSTNFTATAIAAMDNTPASITMVSGNGQSATVGDPLPNPLVARVRNASSQDLNNVTVEWTVTQGAGTLGSPTSNTNAQGQASNTLTVGAGAGPQTVTAAVQSNTSLNVTFNATANAITTAADVTVSNNQFTPVNAKVLATGTVTWTWAAGALAHNVTWITGGFTDSGDLIAGEMHQVTFPAAGTFTYYCSIHGLPGGPIMNGSVTVSN